MKIRHIRETEELWFTLDNRETKLPYSHWHDGFIEELKLQIPASHREYNNETCEWTIRGSEQINRVFDLRDKYFVDKNQIDLFGADDND